MATAAERRDFLVRMPAEDHAALRSLAFLSGRSMNDIVCSVLHEYLKNEGREQLVDSSIRAGQESMRVLLDKLADGPE